jgi:hypothetical protein
MTTGARLLLLLCSWGLAACTPSTDLSGWEIARKKNPSEGLEVYPEIPVILPGAAAPGDVFRTGSPMEGVRIKRLDEGSLFRRGYSAPAP